MPYFLVYAPVSGVVTGHEIYCDSTDHPVGGDGTDLPCGEGRHSPLDIAPGYAGGAVRFYAPADPIARIYITHCHVCTGIGEPWNETMLVSMYDSYYNLRGMVQYSHLANVQVSYNTWLDNSWGMVLAYVPENGSVPDWCFSAPHIHHACGTNYGSYGTDFNCNIFCYQGGTAIYSFTY